MSCDYAYNAGRSKAISQFHKVLNDLLTEATSVKPETLTPPDYWRHIGKQDILLLLLGVVSEMINSPH
jgi:hypothetical protein